MMYYNKLNTTDKLFISYCLAFLMYKKNNQEIANSYLNEIREIFNHEDTKDYRVEYHNFLWLNVNVNYKKMETNDVLRDMIEVYDYYKNLDMKDVAVSALTNIFVYKKEENEILYSLEELLKCPSISDYNFVKSILKDCENISSNLYIKALSIVERYNIKMEVI